MDEEHAIRLRAHALGYGANEVAELVRRYHLNRDADFALAAVMSNPSPANVDRLRTAFHDALPPE